MVSKEINKAGSSPKSGSGLKFGRTGFGLVGSEFGAGFWAQF